MRDLTIWEKIRLLQEWSPLLTFAQAFLATTDAHDKVLVVTDAAEWLASKTPGTKVDDELVAHIAAVLRCPQGESLLRWLISKVDEGVK